MRGPLTPRRRREGAILAVLSNHPHGLLTRFLAQRLGFPSGSRLRADLARLARSGRIEAREIRHWNPAGASQWRWTATGGGARTWEGDGR